MEEPLADGDCKLSVAGRGEELLDVDCEPPVDLEGRLWAVMDCEKAFARSAEAPLDRGSVGSISLCRSAEVPASG